MGSVPVHCCCVTAAEVDAQVQVIDVCWNHISLAASELDLTYVRSCCFVVNVERRADEKLGIDVDLNMREALPIAAVTSGIIRRWNRAHPEACVMKGDWIVEVNGATGASAMMRRLREDSVLCITLLPESFTQAIDVVAEGPCTYGSPDGREGAMPRHMPTFDEIQTIARQRRALRVDDRTCSMICGNQRPSPCTPMLGFALEPGGAGPMEKRS